jgi:hypothetical protein
LESTCARERFVHLHQLDVFHANARAFEVRTGRGILRRTLQLLSARAQGACTPSPWIVAERLVA